MRRRVFSRRKKNALAISYVLAALCVIGGFWRISHNRAEDYKRQVISTYRHALTEVASEVGQMDAALQKCLYAGTPAMISGVCTDIYGKASAAKYALGELSLGGCEFEKTQSFITRVGDYAYALSKKAGAGETLDDEEYENLKSLAGTASVLSGNLTRVLASVNDGKITLESLYRARREPALIYDKPFSTHTSELRPKLLEGAREIIPEEAAMIAENFIGAARNTVKYDGERGGELPVHMFIARQGSETISVEISKTGGKLVTMLSSRTPHGGAISQKDAVSIATRFLQKKGFRDMSVTHHMTEGDTVLVNFAYTQGGVTFYPDLIGVRVSRDNGSIAGVQCESFVMNHHERELPKAETSEEDAREKVSVHLAVLSHAMAVIPTAGQNEAFCHEFKCETGDGRHVLVYVNAVTGAEEKLILLLETEGGTLAV